MLGGFLLLSATGISLFYFGEFNNKTEFINDKLIPLSNSAKNLRVYSTEAYASIERKLFSSQNYPIEEINESLERTVKEKRFLLQNFDSFKSLEDYDKIKKIFGITEKDTDEFLKASYEILQIEATSTGVGTLSDDEFDALYDNIVDRLKALGLQDTYQNIPC